MNAKTRKNLSTLQKRARDKEYRLRSKGAMAEEVKRVSPRLPWEQVEKMTPGQLSAYSRKLNKFNSRQSGFTKLPSGELLTSKEVNQYKNALTQLNKVRKSQQLKGFGVSVGTKPIDIKGIEPPRTRAAAKKRVSRLKEAAINEKKQVQSIRSSKQGVITVLKRAGFSSSDINKIKNMPHQTYKLMWALTGFASEFERLNWAHYGLDLNNKTNDAIQSALKNVGFSDTVNYVSSIINAASSNKAIPQKLGRGTLATLKAAGIDISGVEKAVGATKHTIDTAKAIKAGKAAKKADVAKVIWNLAKFIVIK